MMRAYKVAICLWLTLALMALGSWLMPEHMVLGAWTLRTPNLSEVLGMEVADSLDWAADEATMDSLAIAQQDSIRMDSLKLAEDSVKRFEPIEQQVSVGLENFYAALREADRRPVRVVHYGDSQIEEDRMTSTIRKHLQKRYGGGGVGLIPLHQTIPSMTVAQRLYIDGKLQSAQQGPRRYLVYGPQSMHKADSLYGPMGQVAMMDNELVAGSEKVRLTVEPRGKNKQVSRYFSRVHLLADDAIRMVVNGDTLTGHWASLQDSSMLVEIELEGRGAVYGLSLEDEKGVIVDNIPMRGCMGLVFSAMKQTQLRQFYHESRTELIIMQFGGNAIAGTEKEGTLNAIVSSLEKQVQVVRACAPEASILFVGPSDMATMRDGKMQTYPLIPYMDRQLRRMAQRQQIAYFSLFEAMGGSGSMLHWMEQGLAGSDGVHFSQRGAEIAAERLWNFIEEGMEE